MGPSQMSGPIQLPAFNTTTLAGFWWYLDGHKPARWQCSPPPLAPQGDSLFPLPKNTALEASPEWLNRCHPCSIRQTVPLTAVGKTDSDTGPEMCAMQGRCSWPALVRQPWLGAAGPWLGLVQAQQSDQRRLCQFSSFAQSGGCLLRLWWAVRLAEWFGTQGWSRRLCVWDELQGLSLTLALSRLGQSPREVRQDPGEGFVWFSSRLDPLLFDLGSMLGIMFRPPHCPVQRSLLLQNRDHRPRCQHIIVRDSGWWCRPDEQATPLNPSGPWLASLCVHGPCFDEVTMRGRSSSSCFHPCLCLLWNTIKTQRRNYLSLASSAFKWEIVMAPWKMMLPLECLLPYSLHKLRTRHLGHSKSLLFYGVFPGTCTLIAGKDHWLGGRPTFSIIQVPSPTGPSAACPPASLSPFLLPIVRMLGNQVTLTIEGLCCHIENETLASFWNSDHLMCPSYK